ncbi:MAG TPA: DNA mismatch repair endonuclease MutL [Rubricoccaceae bacterium]|nr:DNA mismatch repair endonuclease MutL [Rubricoccaceae bacterium]
MTDPRSTPPPDIAADSLREPSVSPTPEAQAAADGLVQVLPDVLANKIAAGEVVQRPSSVAKELLENAIDAGASSVELILKRAGSDLVQVVDDGCGMGPRDAVAAFGRHATSKLRAFEDLEKLATLGFRGEALASIAAVAQVELRTRRQQDGTGFFVRLEGGRLVEQRPVAAPPGTSLAVRNLFYNVPARRNFLKSPATEFKHLVETFQTLALSNPRVGFTLCHDEAEVYGLPAAPDAEFEEALRRRVGDLFGERHDTLVPVEETTSYLSVRGFVGRPEHARRSRGEQFFFVNGRWVKSRALDHAVAAAFGGLLLEGTYPFFVLFLHVDPRHVDVNVHPTKTEVKFDDERGVYGFVQAVVKKGLGAADLALPWTAETIAAHVASADFPASEGGAPAERPAQGAIEAAFSRPEGARLPPDDLSTTRRRSFEFAPPVEGDGSAPLTTGFPSEAAPPPRPIPSRAEAAPDADLEAAVGAPGREWPIWPLHDRYVLTPIRSGLLVLDQQAAHERILYERALTAMEGGLAASQQLLFPHTVDLDPAEHALLSELLPDLRTLGFQVEPLSGRSVLIRGVPSDVRLGAERTVLEDLLAQYRANRDSFQLQGRENLARALARRSAIKPGHPLKPAEARSLIDQLFACRMPYVDPAGRPTMIKLTLEEFERRFSRR